MRLSRQFGVAASLSAVSAFLMMGCTAPVESTENARVTAAAKSLDFAYDTTIDQITHMSCANLPMANPLSYNGSAYFTFRAGAYTTGGVSLKNSFYSSLKAYSFDSQAEILEASKANSNTVLQLALRSRDNRQAIKVRTGTSAVAGQDYFNMFASLSNMDVAPSLVRAPVNTRVRYLRNGMAGGYNLEGSLYFTQGPQVVQDIRDFAQGIGTNGAGMLAVTYTNGTPFSARSAADVVAGSTANNQVSVYGRGYIPTFAQPPGLSQAPSPTYPRNVMTSILETSLDGSALTPAPAWVCPQTMQLRIVRAEDAANPAKGTNCVRQSDPTVPSGALTANMLAQLKLLRNTLKVEDWYIDMLGRCMIPKHADPGCYGPVTAVDYQPSDTCGVDANGNSNCLQWASTCYRTN